MTKIIGGRDLALSGGKELVYLKIGSILLDIFKNQREMEQRLLNFKSLVNVMLTKMASNKG